MIIQALCSYYERKMKAGDLAPDGYEYRNIPFIIVLNEDGEFLHLLSTQVSEADRESGKRSPLFTVPKGHESRTGASGYKKPNLLWDHAGYVLNYSEPPKKPGSKEEEALLAKALNQHEYFIRLVDEIALETNDRQIQAVQKFLYSDEQKERVKNSEEWASVIKSKSTNMSFKILGEDHLVCESKAAQYWVKKLRAKKLDEYQSQCLVTGEKVGVSRLHPPIKGVPDTAPSGAALVSFNSPPTRSYGLEDGYNAPVSSTAARQYGEALNHLLRKHSPNKFTLSDMAMVCWAEKGSDLESMIPNNFMFAAKDDPDAGIDRVISAVNVIHSKGRSSAEGKQYFYLLGLKGANGRVAVQYWKRATVYDIGESLRTWFEDVQIPARDYGEYVPSLYSLACDISLKGDIKNLSPNILPTMVRAIFEGKRLPQTVIKAALTRIKAERNVTRTRAALIKAFLNREARHLKQSEGEIGMLFGLEGKPVGYKLGALMAVYEKIQEDSAKYSVGASVRDRFYTSFSSRPASVLANLDRLSRAHLSKLKRNRPAVYHSMQKRLKTLMVEIDIESLPASMNAKEQSYFAVGYYQQREDFFRKKNETKTVKGAL